MKKIQYFNSLIKFKKNRIRQYKLGQNYMLKSIIITGHCTFDMYSKPE